LGSRNFSEVSASPHWSLRDIAIRGGAPEQVILKLPDVWNSAEAARRLSIPLFWLHSRSYKTIPIDLGQQVYDAKAGAEADDLIDRFDHNAIYTMQSTRGCPTQSGHQSSEFAKGV
jgi:hypothetical protein